MTFGASGDAADALDAKLKGMARANVSTAPAVSQALVLSALRNPDLPAQQTERFTESVARYDSPQDCTGENPAASGPVQQRLLRAHPHRGRP